MPATIPITTRTTSSSISVNQAAHAAVDAGSRSASEVPRSDVGVDARAARLAVGAEAEDVDLAAQPGFRYWYGWPHGSFGSRSR